MKMMMMKQVCFHFYYFDAAKVMKLFETRHKKNIFCVSENNSHLKFVSLQK